ncbi:MAG: hypothetical protein FD180_647 [Planctomycetota bacterium]|nr:MAG: hypothetical protein FD180_647 [Planctomycetota bacterium]
MADKPNVIVIAGPNGAGKSTSAPILLARKLKVEEFVNADVIAKGLSGFAPEKSAIAAGRIMLDRLKELAERRATFAFETTLASRTFAHWLKELVSSGYEFHLFFLTIPTPDLSVARVAGRVMQGGHHVPEVDIRRRFDGGLRNFFSLYRPIATTWKMYDNAERKLRFIAMGSAEGTEAVADRKRWDELKRSYSS